MSSVGVVDKTSTLFYDSFKTWYGRVHFLNREGVKYLKEQITALLRSVDTMMMRTLRVWAYLLFGGPELPNVQDLIKLSSYGDDSPQAFFLKYLVAVSEFVHTLTSADLELLFQHRSAVKWELMLEILEESPVTLNCETWQGYLFYSIVNGIRLANLNIFSLALERLNLLKCPHQSWARLMWSNLLTLEFNFHDAGDWIQCGPLSSYLRRLHIHSPWLLKHELWNSPLDNKTSVDVAALMSFMPIYEVYLADSGEATVREAEAILRRQLKTTSQDAAEQFMLCMDYILALVNYTYDDEPTERSRLLYNLLTLALKSSCSSEIPPIMNFSDKNLLYLLQFWLRHQDATVPLADIEYHEMDFGAFAVVLRHLGPSRLPKLGTVDEYLKVVFDNFERLTTMTLSKVLVGKVEKTEYTMILPKFLFRLGNDDLIIRLLRMIAFAVLKIPLHVSLMDEDCNENSSSRELTYYVQYWVDKRWPNQNIVVNVVFDQKTEEKPVEDELKGALPSLPPSV